MIGVGDFRLLFSFINFSQQTFDNLKIEVQVSRIKPIIKFKQLIWVVRLSLWILRCTLIKVRSEIDSLKSGIPLSVSLLILPSPITIINYLRIYSTLLSSLIIAADHWGRRLAHFATTAGVLNFDLHLLLGFLALGALF